MSADPLRIAAQEMNDEGGACGYVADSLEQHADLHDTFDCPHVPSAAVQLARAYLGTDA